MTKTEIVNQALIALGELVITDVDTDTTKRGTTMAALWTPKLQYLLKKYRWRFATKRATLTEVDCKLLFDSQTEDFTLGDVLTDASGAYGTLVHVQQIGATGTFWFSDVTGTFTDDDAITGVLGGAAVVNGTNVDITPVNEYDNIYALPSDYIHFLSIYPRYIDYKIESNFILCSESDTIDIRYIYNATDPTEFDSAFAEAFAALLARESAVQITDSLRKREKMDEMFEDKIADARFAGSIEEDPEQIEILEEDDWLQARY